MVRSRTKRWVDEHYPQFDPRERKMVRWEHYPQFIREKLEKERKMVRWLDDVLGITSTILSLGVLGPVGMAAGAGVGALAKVVAKKEKEENAEREQMISAWMDFARAIDKLKTIDNIARWKMLTETITVDLIAKAGKLPKERQVQTYAQLVVGVINGDFKEGTEK